MVMIASWAWVDMGNSTINQIKGNSLVAKVVFLRFLFMAANNIIMYMLIGLTLRFYFTKFCSGITYVFLTISLCPVEV
jgi:hypothetical protein